MKRSYLLRALMFLMFMISTAEATPSTYIWNPSVDIQPRGTFHFGIDNYFTIEGPGSGGYAYPTDTGLTYGLSQNIEVGFDIFLPQANPFTFNAKLGLPENGNMPAFAFGGYAFGTQKGLTDQNVLYAIAAKSLPLGRFSAGYFSGNPAVLVDPSGNPDNNGFILAWDKNFTDKLWISIDYASSRSALGALFAGLSYAFSSNTSVLFAYGAFNNGAKPVVTTQLDINI